MLGLAIDGGGMYFLWRDAQNASDASVLAASYARCTGADTAHIQQAGLQAAAQNGFDNNGVSNTVAVYTPPIAGSAIGKKNYIQVDITAVKPAYFIQLVYHGPLQITTRAVGYCDPPFNPATVPAIFAGAGPECNQNNVKWAGGATHIEGGVWSNDDILFSGGGGEISGDVGSTGNIDPGHSNTYSPAPSGDQHITKDDPLNLDMADFSPGGSVATSSLVYAVPSAINPATGNAYDPDFHSGKWTPGGGRTLEGVYYVDGDISIGPNDVVYSPEGVTFAATGTIDINAHADVSFGYYKHGGNGILAFTTANTGCTVNAMHIGGSGGTWYGVLYAPAGNIQVSLSSGTMIGAMIGYSITEDGSDLTLIYDPTILPPRPPNIQVAE
jgi:hypothetical protein